MNRGRRDYRTPRRRIQSCFSSQVDAPVLNQFYDALLCRLLLVL